MKTNDKVLLAILWPFSALISALRNWRQPWAMNVFWVVCIYLGAIQIYHPEGTVLGDGIDGGRYVMQLMDMHNGNRGLFEQFAYGFAVWGSMDFYQLILTWIVSIFTDNGHVLFACFAAVFGYFYSRNIWYVLNRISEPLGWCAIIFVAILFLDCPIWQINGVRMWTATHVFMYAILPYICEGNKKRLLWLIAVPFIHFSFLYFVVVSAIAVLLPDKFTSNSGIVKWGLVAIFIGSLGLSAVNIPAITNALEQFSPNSYQDRVELYTRDTAFERLEAGKTTVNWYVNAASDIQFWVSNILLLVVALSRLNEVSTRKLLNFALFISAIANIASQIPSGGRFLVIAHLFSYSLIVWQITKLDSQNLLVFKVAKIAAIPLLITLVFGIRSGLDYYGISLFCGNFLSALFWDNNVPFINFIK